MITEEQLDSLLEFGKEEDGSYCDRWQFSIKKKFGKWNFYLFCEVDGALTHVKVLKDFEDLKNVYKAITDQELEYKK